MFRRRPKRRFPAPDESYVRMGDDTCFRRMDYEGYNLQRALVENARDGDERRGLTASDINAWGQVWQSTKPGVQAEVTLLVNDVGTCFFFAVRDRVIGPGYGPRAWQGAPQVMWFFEHSRILGMHPDDDDMTLWNWTDPNQDVPYIIALAPMVTGEPGPDRKSMEVISTLVAFTNREFNERR